MMLASQATKATIEGIQSNPIWNASPSPASCVRGKVWLVYFVFNPQRSQVLIIAPNCTAALELRFTFLSSPTSAFVHSAGSLVHRASPN